MSSLGEAVKSVCGKITSSGAADQVDVLQHVLLPSLRDTEQEVTDDVVSTLIRVLGNAVQRHQYRKPRQEVENVISALLTRNGNGTIKAILGVFEEFTSSLKKAMPSHSGSMSALVLLSWSCIASRHLLKETDSEDWKQLVKCQTVLLSATLVDKRKSIQQSAKQKLKVFWQEDCNIYWRYNRVLERLTPSQHSVCFVSHLFSVALLQHDSNLVNVVKATAVDLYVKVVLGGKTHLSDYILMSFGAVLKHIDHDTFSSSLLPAIQKALLRTPEASVAAVSCLVEQVPIDLSRYSLDICKPLGTQLTSKTEWMRQAAACALKNLAVQCSDGDAVNKMIELLFGILNGSEKLTLWEQRAGVLTGLASLSYHKVTGNSSSNALSLSVIELIIPLLEREVHDGVLSCGLSTLGLWTAKFSDTLPSSLLAFFKKWFGKGTSVPRRIALLRCMLMTFKGNCLVQGIDFVPQLLTAFDKAVSQVHQPTIATEGLTAAALLVQLSSADATVEPQLIGFWNTLLSAEKQTFTAQKFLNAASSEALTTLLELTERLMTDHIDKLDEKQKRPWAYTLFAVCLHSSFKLRQKAQSMTKKLLMYADSDSLRQSLFEFYREALSVQDNPHQLQKSILIKPDDTLPTIKTKLREAKSLAELLWVLVSVPVTAEKEDKANIAVDIFLTAHHPSIVYFEENAWLKVVKKLGLIVSEILNEYGSVLWQHVVIGLQPEENNCSAKNGLKMLCQLASDDIMALVMEKVESGLKDDRLMLVTQHEIDVFSTPEGELCDKSIIIRAETATAVVEQNVKRESRAYSYEEQQWDRQLREELEQKKGQKSSTSEGKRGQKGKGKSGGGSSGGATAATKGGVQLEKKQQEAFEALMKEEAAIRKRVKQLDGDYKSTVNLLSTVIESNASAIKPYVPFLIENILCWFKVPLASAGASMLWLKLREVVFTSQWAGLGTLVAHVTLRLLQPLSGIDPSWSQEPLSAQAMRAVERLLSATTSKSGLSQTMFPTPTFAYCFPLLRQVLHDGGECVQNNLTSRQQAAQFILVHSKTRKTSAEDDPDLLPRDQILRVLGKVIATSSSLRAVAQLQDLAISAFAELCEGASGKDGCGCAKAIDIQVLLECLTSPVEELRLAAIKGLQSIIDVLPSSMSDKLTNLLIRRIFVAQFDADERVQACAKQLWSEANLVASKSLCLLLIGDVLDSEHMASSASMALAALLQDHPDMLTTVAETLFDAYKEKLKVPEVVKDDIGRVISLPFIDPWQSRCGIAVALEKMSPQLRNKEVDKVFSFFVQNGLADRVQKVRQQMLHASMSALNIHGKENIHNLLPVFENFLETAPNTPEVDPVRQSVVILIGSLARYLDQDDPKVKPIVDKLIKALDTPSQQVQETVANCLPPLIPAVRDSAAELVAQLMEKLLEGSQFGERKGAAYGLAGVVKGLGVSSLTQLGIAEKLQETVTNKKNYKHREGALFVFETLSSMLGRLYEPHVIKVIPNLLVCFGDGNQYVREAASDTARAMMAQMSGHGVKRILPSLMSALDDESWRTKTGSVELLGKMAYCAPQQLSACLPSIVPRLMEVLTDSHAKVQHAGTEALKQIGSVIRNPEIQALVPLLLEAMSDIAGKSQNCLQMLLQTQFVHTVDAASLALIMPIVERSLEQRSTETKRMACQLLGDMYTLTTAKDLEPYVPAIMPGLKAALVDPVPEVRSVTARALGSMVKAMGGDSFDDIVPWLLGTIQSEQSNVDRSGGAQGLCEVLLAQGPEKLEEMMPAFIYASQNSDHPAHVRDGYLTLFVHLPGAFGDRFIEYVADIIPPILKGLSDESEFVRDTALTAGQGIVTHYAETAVEVFLPQLEKGLSDENWRIRYSSIQLLGDLLYHISGVTGKMSTVSEEDDNFGTEYSTQALIQTLGLERRNRVLSGLYMSRSDEAVLVRQTALHVWKIVVANTARTLRDILQDLLKMLLLSLATESDERRQVAARTLGDIVRKLGERVLPDIIPILENGLLSESSVERQGVCVGLSEIMASTTKDYVQAYQDSLIPTIRRALCDPLPEVRVAAAMTFDTLHSNIGPKALEDILPSLLNILKNGSGDEVDFALDGLKQVMTVKSRVVMPFLVPKLTSPPINAKALALLSAVAGDALTRHLITILPALLRSLSTMAADSDCNEELEASKTLVLSVSSEVGVRCVMDELIAARKNPNPGIRKASVVLLQAFCSETRTDYSQHVPRLLIELIQLFGDDEHSVVTAAWDALNAVIEKLPAADQLACIVHVRQGIKFVKSEFEGDLPGFCLPKKGIKPLLQILREGVLNGSPEQKEQAASGLGDVITLTSAEALKQHVVQITGPLIRILGDRFSWNVKVAILETLSLVIVKSGVTAKAFVPQLQTTFVKALNDANQIVRLRAAFALEKLVVLQNRVDPLFNDLSTGIKSNEEPGIKQTLLLALQGALRSGGSRMSEGVRHTMTGFLSGLLQAPDDTVQKAAAGCVGALCVILPDNELSQLVTEHFLDDRVSDEWNVRYGRSLAMREAFVSAFDRILTADNRDRWLDTVVSHTSSDRVSLCTAGLACVEALLSSELNDVKEVLLPCIVKCLLHSSNDVRVATSATVKQVAKTSRFSIEDLQQLVPPLIESTSEKNSPVRLSAEQALVSILELRKNSDRLQECLAAFDNSIANSLLACYKKTLSKCAAKKDDNTEADEL